MNINTPSFNWNGTLSKRNETNFIILHHRAGNGDVQSIHQQHLKNGWTGIGYHFYIRKDGSIYACRPIDTIGAHTIGKNQVSVGICFEGNFESQDYTMPQCQLSSGIELINYLKKIYENAKPAKHSDFQSTACPGRYFPFDKIVHPENELLKTPEDITHELNLHYFKIDDKQRFTTALAKAKSENSSLYWGYYKLVNKIAKP